jgi:REP element-mobilizing transposase RayT
MARPLRLEFAGALYHVTSRGDRREDVFLCDADRQDWLAVLATVCERFNWVIHAFCQMSNHYHLLVETVDGNLARGMRQLNGHYSQCFNHRHGLVGHLFQGRYKAILVQKEAYLLELSRYVVLNPLRARMVTDLLDWPWSSYPMLMGRQAVPDWLDADWLLNQFGSSRDAALACWHDFVMAGRDVPSPLLAQRHQLLLGDDVFAQGLQQQPRLPAALREVSKAHRRTVALSLADYQSNFAQRDDAMAQAYLSGAYTMAAIAEHFSVHYMTVSRAVNDIKDTHVNCRLRPPAPCPKSP